MIGKKIKKVITYKYKVEKWYYSIEFNYMKNMKNWRWVVDSTTAASRSKLSKQCVHIKSNIVNPILMADRRKWS